MPISPTNQSKNSISPSNVNKAKRAAWGDILAKWGDAIFAWGFGVESYINQSKSQVASYLQLQDGTAFLLQDGTNLELQGGSGALVYTNVSKS
jgi:hypothetical protein